MDKQALYDHVTHVEKQIGELYKEIGNIKQYVVQLLEENHHLQMENYHLRERLEDRVKQEEPSLDKESKESTHKKPVVGEGYDNLARLYHEGFHICNVHYGSIRREGDDCLFCLSFLNK